MAVDGSSTDAQVEIEYDNTVGYALTGDVSLAQRHFMAASILVRRTTDKISRGGNSVESRTQLEMFSRSARDAMSYLRSVGALPMPSSAATSQPVRVFDMSGVRE